MCERKSVAPTGVQCAEPPQHADVGRLSQAGNADSGVSPRPEQSPIWNQVTRIEGLTLYIGLSEVLRQARAHMGDQRRCHSAICRRAAKAQAVELRRADAQAEMPFIWVRRRPYQGSELPLCHAWHQCIPSAKGSPRAIKGLQLKSRSKGLRAGGAFQMASRKALLKTLRSKVNSGEASAISTT